MKDLRVRLEEIKESMRLLKIERETIETKLRNESTDFKEQVEIWYNSEDKKHVSDVFVLRNYPEVYNFFKVYDCNRYQTYDFTEIFEETAIGVIEDEPVNEKYLLALKEIVLNNLGSVEYDW
jgi:hypothetical protein